MLAVPAWRRLWLGVAVWWQIRRMLEGHGAMGDGCKHWHREG